jgi:hypothetical protein
LRWLISSIPIQRSPASRSRRPVASAATRSQIEPTVRHAIRNSSATALREHRTASHAAWSSKALVKRDPWRAQGTAQTTTPCSRQATLGASAST